MITLDLTTLLFIVSAAFTGAGFLIRSVLGRISILESRIQDSMSEVKVRQLIQDKYDPIQEDIHEIKDKLNKIFDLYVKTLNSKKD